MVFVNGTPFAMWVPAEMWPQSNPWIYPNSPNYCSHTCWSEHAGSDPRTHLLAEKQASFPIVFITQTSLSISILHGSEQRGHGQIFSSLIQSVPTLASVFVTAFLGRRVDHLLTIYGSHYKNTVCLPTSYLAPPITCGVNCHREDTALQKDDTKWMSRPLRRCYAAEATHVKYRQPQWLL